ncbi:MAG: homoserine kinase [Byssovorax sp.]
MATLTPLLLDDARRLGAAYGLDVASVRGIPAGSVNSNYALTLGDGGRAFLRVYEEQQAASAAGEARLLADLEARGVKTPRPLALAGDEAGGFIAEHAGKPVAVFPWIEGDSLCQKRVTPDAVRKLGAALAEVHLAGDSFVGAPPSRFGEAQLASRLRRLEAIDLDAELAPVVARLGADLALLASRPSVGEGLIHGDLFRDNVLWHEGEISALLDFESASIGSRPFDLMVTVLAWCFGDSFDRELARSLAGGYTARRPLPEDEAAALHAEGSFAVLRFSVTRITDFELRPRGSGMFRDYRRFLARRAALAELGPRALRTLLGV